MNQTNVILQSNSAMKLFDVINTHTAASGYTVKKLWYRSLPFRTIYYVELAPPIPKPPPPPPPLPKLAINIGPVSNRISLEPKVKLVINIGPVSNRNNLEPKVKLVIKAGPVTSRIGFEPQLKLLFGVGPITVK